MTNRYKDRLSYVNNNSNNKNYIDRQGIIIIFITIINNQSRTRTSVEQEQQGPSNKPLKNFTQ